MNIITKYNCGDLVFWILGGKVRQTPINAIKVNYSYASDKELSIRYRVAGTKEDTIKNQVWIQEEKLFDTKEQLLQTL